ncbi:MAG: hypothetical protein KAH31_09060 [Candidatus Sabulitectum sp.]|nr:hypothetical protein [Candidatus Sabulitectum sp.]
MKHLILILTVSVMAFAGTENRGTDDISLTLLNNWTALDQIRGLDVYEYGSYFVVLATDIYAMEIQSYEPATGTYLGAVDISSGNTSVYGVATQSNSDTPCFLTNDFDSDTLYYSDNMGSGWSTFTNPTGIRGRGMDFDGTHYWTIDIDNGGLWRFQPGGSQQNFPTPELTASSPSGVTTFPYQGNTWIAIAPYSNHFIYFYKWNGTAISFMGYASIPLGGSYYSLGLAYAETNGHMYWSYYAGSGETHLAELSFEITALERSSWGSIKHSF